MARLDKFEESKRIELLKKQGGNSLIDFFYQYSIKMEQGDRYDTDEFMQIMDTWGDIRTELLRRLDG